MKDRDRSGSCSRFYEILAQLLINDGRDGVKVQQGIAFLYLLLVVCAHGDTIFPIGAYGCASRLFFCAGRKTVYRTVILPGNRPVMDFKEDFDV
jgi:hypothetical protein